MRTSLSRVRLARLLGVSSLLAVLLLPVGVTWAQVCGDADGDGMVTDVDGVNALRAAASLSSMCTLASCDVNVDGMITDTDGVIILRKAASLPVTANCIPTGGPVDQRAALLVKFTQALLSNAFQYIPQVGHPVTPGTISCVNSFDDGEIDIEEDSGETFVTFFECEIDGMILDGEVDDTADGLTVDVAVLSTFNDDELDFSGEGFQVVQTASSLRISGPLDASPSFETASLADASDFTMALQSFEVAGGTGTLTGGTARLDLTDAEITGLDEITLAYDGSNLVLVTITKDDASSTQALYNLDTRNFL